ncbi:hypothetical protein RJZ56_007828 [Blastomyces dermatitidis]|uniref:Uncharacterized protein n=2 Tax=Ajellomyces dermatitidis TaxID=5039 RepID=F2T8W3_AJEDA|nr:uncharacterized protein BDCG_02001 [Blastomyces dermatitidis ER-3]EEQ86881.1 hypothetical protein BDCG_02001 [Blastomyces dermatitidis ER-3]EGE79676.1 hypothetical protein BDDG_02617 [Blastomyces dermatitidis ATCC 18188]EQL34182.1 hypothetical protein BDFG_03852 [Blastomyces dermatitidis ATCC 26199]
MSGTAQPTLSQDIVAELEAKKKELEQLQSHLTQLDTFINDLHLHRQELEQLSTSARNARGGRTGVTTLTIDQEMAKHQQDLINTSDKIAAIESSIRLLSQP